MLLIQETTLGDHDGDTLAQPRGVRRQRRARRVPEKGKDGPRVGLRERRAPEAEGLELGGGEGGEVGAQAAGGGGEDVAEAGDGVIAGEGGGGDAFEAAEGDSVAVVEAVGVVGVEPGFL